MLKLRIEPAAGEPSEREVTGPTTVGRGSQCDVTIDDRYLSRLHARLWPEGERWLLEDMGSRNGTSLNGESLSTAAELKPGDVIQLSTTLVTVLATDSSAAPGAGDSSTVSTSPSATILRPASELVAGSDIDAAADASPAELRRYATRLRILNEVHRALGRPIELEALLDLILDHAFRELSPEEGAVYLATDDRGLVRAATKSTLGREADLLESATLVHEVVDQGQAALVLDTDTDQRFGDAASIMASGVRSLVAAPLSDPEGCLGMITLNSRLHRRQFDESDLELLASLASIAAMRIRNVALAEEAVERRRLEDEIRLARQIQVALLPRTIPEIAGYELVGRNLPSRTVSGDFFEIVPRSEGRECVLLVADVSGKGVAAAVLTASFEALAAGPIANGVSPDRVCAQVSRLLYERTPAAKYATAWLGAVDVDSGVLRWANAGHLPALLMHSDGEIERLEPTGLPIGLLPGAEYLARESRLEPGDLLVVYTDGITEAENASGEEYGEERLVAVCRQHAGCEPSEVQRALEEDLDRFTGGTAPSDDRTVLLASRTPR